VIRRIVREDPVVVLVIFAFALSQIFAMGWDLPGAYGWENDGTAPRDFFGGIGLNLSPGKAHGYPLFHNLVVGVLSIPVLLPAALAADSWSMNDLMPSILSVPTMTGVSIVAKTVGLLMGCVSLLILARIARRTVNASAGRWAALWAATCLTFAYYARTSNLDGPYLMWTALAIDRLLTLAESHSRRDYVLFGVLAGAAIATKDQAYASFVLPGLVYLLALPLTKQNPFGPRPTHYLNVGWATLSGALSLGLLGGAFVNPTGFALRVRNMTGASSRDWRDYARTTEGLAANVRDILESQETMFWPWIAVAICWIGVALVVFRKGGTGLRSRAFRLLPLSVAVGSIAFFTLVVGRSEHRFCLPMGYWLSYYGGVASAAFVGRMSAVAPQTGRLSRAALGAVVVWSALHSFQVHLTQLGDARNQVVDYLDKLEPGTLVETYGLLVHLPHFDVSPGSPYRLERVSRRPLAERNPLLGATEIDEPYGNIQNRAPDVLVVPEHSLESHVPRKLDSGRAESNMWKRAQADSDARAFFEAIRDDTLNGYEVRLVAEPTLPRWASALGLRPVRVHQSVGNRQWILVRTER
jgi:hypothetical protein